MFKNINISKNRTFSWHHFEKTRFLPIFPKISTGKKLLFRYICLYVQKYQHYEEKQLIFRSLWKIVLSPFLQKYQNSRKRTFLGSLWKNCFLPICPNVATLSGKGRYFDITLKNSFLPILSKISKFERNNFLWDLFEKIGCF